MWFVNCALLLGAPHTFIVRAYETQILVKRLICLYILITLISKTLTH